MVYKGLNGGVNDVNTDVVRALGKMNVGNSVKWSCCPVSNK